jgi:pimeloyl-ACP methyl ester carboxylesterase
MLGAIPEAGRDPVRLGWSRAFTDALAALDDAVLAERLALIASEDVGADLGSLRIPVVLVQFERDLVVRARERGHLEGVCHNAQVVRFPGPHFAIEVQPLPCALAIGGRIRAVLDEHRPEPGAP